MTLDPFDQFMDAELWVNFHEQMDMIFVTLDLY